MATFIFSAARQLIFYVTVEGRRLLVQFEERNQFGASNFTTTNEKVADAIRKHSMFERGIISENTPPQEVKKKRRRDRTNGADGVNGADVAENAQRQDDTPEEPRDSEQGEGDLTPPSPDESDDNVIEVENFTQAKEAVIKRLGVSVDSIKTPILLNKVCKDNGLKIKYTKQ